MMMFMDSSLKSQLSEKSTLRCRRPASRQIPPAAPLVLAQYDDDAQADGTLTADLNSCVLFAMFAKLNGIKLHYEERGNADGMPLLFIHGFPLSGELWNDLIPFLEKNYRLIIPDLRGFGQSELTERPQVGVTPMVSIEQYTDDLAQLLELIGEGRPCVVIGLSMGGYIAFEMYRRYASSVRALVLADTRPEADTQQRRRERFETACKVLAQGSKVVADDMVAKLLGPDAPVDVRHRWHTIMARTAPESVAAALYAMAARDDSTPTLSHIYCPTLIIVGEHDQVTPPDVARSMNRAIAASEVVVIPHAGHMTPVEQPHAFAEALVRFLARLGPCGNGESSNPEG
jgi:3-oxoadipate enol-lactonase